MTDKELMQEVLEAMESLHRTGDTQVFDMCAAPVLIPALRERLAQPEQKPVSGVVLDEHGSAALVNNGAEEWHCKNRNARRLYTAPPQRTWAGSGDIEDSNAYLAAEREKVVAWMTQRSYATGHGDTIEDLIKELEWQVAEREREECAQLCETKHFSSPIREAGAKDCAAAIRARGQA